MNDKISLLGLFVLFFFLFFKLIHASTTIEDEMNQCQEAAIPSICVGKVIARELIDFYIQKYQEKAEASQTCTVIMYDNQLCRCTYSTCRDNERISVTLAGPDFNASCLEKLSTIRNLIWDYNSHTVNGSCFNTDFSGLEIACQTIHLRCYGGS